MSEHDAERPQGRSSIEEALELLGLGRGSVSSPVPSSEPQPLSAVSSEAERYFGDGALSTEILRDTDGVRRLHVHGCGRQPVRLSRSRCQALLRGWEQLASFAVKGGRPDTSLTDQVAVREVNGMIVVEIGGEIGRPLRFTPEKLAKLLKAKEPIRQFAGN